MTSLEISDSSDPKARNIRLIVPLKNGSVYIFKDATLHELLRRMALKVRYLQAKVFEAEKENAALLILCADAVADENEKRELK